MQFQADPEEHAEVARAGYSGQQSYCHSFMHSFTMSEYSWPICPYFVVVSQVKIGEQKITIFSALQKPLASAFAKFSGPSVTPELELLKLEVPKQINITI